jgi:hypothetical protein
MDSMLLLVSMLVSTVGLGIFWYGKKQRRIPQLAVGLLMMVFPYFIPSALVVGIVGAVLCIALFVLVRLGA